MEGTISALSRRALCFALLWWVLAEGRTSGWPFGLFAVGAATLASARLTPAPRQIRWPQVPVFLVYFIGNSLRGGWQVALMALRGRRALQPAFVDLPHSLPAGAARVLFTNALCMMPGTVGVQLAEASLRVHVLDARLSTAAMVSALEQRVAALFGMNP